MKLLDETTTRIRLLSSRVGMEAGGGLRTILQLSTAHQARDGDPRLWAPTERLLAWAQEAGAERATLIPHHGGLQEANR